jgi:hypothetical protein
MVNVTKQCCQADQNRQRVNQRHNISPIETPRRLARKQPFFFSHWNAIIPEDCTAYESESARAPSSARDQPETKEAVWGAPSM